MKLLHPLTLLAFSLQGTPALSAPPSDLAVQAGAHVIFSYPGTTPPQELLDLIAAGKVGGLILFGENVDDNLPAHIQRFQEVYAASPAYAGTPLIISTDQEGGEVRRLPGGPEAPARAVGDAKDPVGAATQAGKDAAAALKKYQMNANLAPVLDIYREAGDFADEFGRSYGNTSERVDKCASAFIKAQQAEGVLAAAKHFPGLGAAPTDSNTDEQPVTLDLTVDELRSKDEAPYQGAMLADVAMVMAAWAIYPAVDPKMPAGLSEAWIQGELRQRLGYTGVTVTDAIEAGALTAFGDDSARAILAAQAGMDLLLAAARNVTQGAVIVDALVAAVEDGSVSKEEFDAGTERIFKLRERL